MVGEVLLILCEKNDYMLYGYWKETAAAFPSYVVGLEGFNAGKVNRCPDDSEKDAATSIGNNNSAPFPDDAGHNNLEKTARTEKDKSEVSQKERSLPDRREEDEMKVSESTSQTKKKKASKGTGSSAQTVSSQRDKKKEGPSLTAVLSEGTLKKSRGQNIWILCWLGLLSEIKGQ